MHAQIRRHRVRRGARGPRVPVFFFNDTATTEIYTLSLHDALPILPKQGTKNGSHTPNGASTISWNPTKVQRSEEHTSELQSLAYLVCRLLLEKKKTVGAIAIPLQKQSEGGIEHTATRPYERVISPA